jgi:DNA-binding NarL/FixJ family response regulator
MAPEGGHRVIAVMVVDDHPLVRAGLRGLISAAADLVIVAEAGSGEDSLALAAEHRPDVVLMDLSMPGIGGVEATRRLIDQLPGLPVVVLTSFHDQPRVLEALRAGAVGYLLKDSDPADVLSAIRSAAQGHAPLDPRIARVLLPSAAPPAQQLLSAREEQVLRLVARGMSNKQIGFELGIAERTVKVHVGHVFRRIDVADRTSAALWARDNLPGA